MKFKPAIWILLFCVTLAGICWYRSRPALKTGSGSVIQESDDKTITIPKAVSPEKSARVNASVSSDLSSSVHQILDTALSNRKRLSAARNLGVDLNPADVDRLCTFLSKGDFQDESPFGQVLKNEVMDQLCELETPRFCELLTRLFEDKSQNVVVRDYALQHIIEYYQRAAESSHDEVPEGEWVRVAGVLWAAVRETDSSIAGTALLGLSRLSTKQREFDRERVGAAANQLVSDTAAGQFTRTAAIQVCAQLSVTDALPAIWQTAQTGETIPLQTSAIAALGMMDQTNAVPFLTAVMSSSAEPLKPAAKQALRQIAKLEKQRAKTQEEQLERQELEELKRQKAGTPQPLSKP